MLEMYDSGEEFVIEVASVISVFGHYLGYSQSCDSGNLL